MPVTDFGGDDAWLQALMANYGASQPYDPTQHPSLTPDAGAPGGGVLHYPAQTPGAPSMGYPALTGPPGAQPPPAAAPQGSPLGFSLTSNPIANWFRNNVSVGAPNFANIAPDAVRDARALGHWLWNAPSSPAATATRPPAAPGAKRTDAAYGAYDDPNGPAPVGDYVSRVGNYPSWPTPPAGGAPVSSPVSSAIKRTDAAYGGYDAPASPGAGAPQGSPSHTPRPALRSSRFVTIDRVNAGPLAQPGRGYQTALNLANLFGRS